MATNIGTNPQDIPLNQYLGELAFLDYPAAIPCMLAHQINHDSTYPWSQDNKISSIEIVQFGDVR